MAKILIATEKPFAAQAVNGIREVVKAAGMELVLLEKYTEKSQLVETVRDMDAMIVRSDKIDAEVLDAAKHLKIVVRAGAGYDNVDLRTASEQGVCVMNTPGQNSNAVAELVFGLLISGMRNFYNGTASLELRGKKLGILAYGNVGRNVARIAKGFGMDISAYDAYCPVSSIEQDGVRPVDSAADLFKTCQIVSLHIPATIETKGSINYKLMHTMPQGAVLINTARKEVMDEASILQMMSNRPDFKYLTDVKPDIDAELSEDYVGRYFSTPKKMGAQTKEANINAGIAAARQIVDFLMNGNEKYRVN